MFVDSVDLFVRSGNGGAGAVSFRKEKFVQFGGPDGGDGGAGGDVYILVDNNTNTLSFYKQKRKFEAKNGSPGMGKNMSGKSGDDLILIVPPGTSVYDLDNSKLLFDLLEDGKKVLLLKGGKGGLGNSHFKNSINQRPEYAQPGIKGSSLNIRFELKLIADVGLVGFPNVGKSTLISTISNAKPQIANYEFTTLTPKLGLVDIDMLNSYVMADIPGIIEGASDGKGLGLKFLKHIERTKVLLFMIDLSNYRDISQQFKTLKSELLKFDSNLALKPYAIVFTKSDAIENADKILDNFLNEFNFSKLQEGYEKDIKKPYFVINISSATNLNINRLKFLILQMLKDNE